MAIQFNVGKSEIWGLQYHPEIPFNYMVKLIKQKFQMDKIKAPQPKSE